MITIDLLPINRFLAVSTSDAWIDYALMNITILLIDHANCEKKAASTAINLIYRYPEQYTLCQQMSRIAREELRHFEQVLACMVDRHIIPVELSASRYATTLRQHCRKSDPGRLIDILIIGAFIEARSCERFAALSIYLDSQLRSFYQRLLRSEYRHFEHYLEFAKQYAKDRAELEARIAYFRALETELIVSVDPEFRFHSGIPVVS